jgi:hypothetical protein
MEVLYIICINSVTKPVNIDLCESWGFHGGVLLYCGLNCHETVKSCKLLRMFRMDILSLHL